MQTHRHIAILRWNTEFQIWFTRHSLDTQSDQPKFLHNLERSIVVIYKQSVEISGLVSMSRKGAIQGEHKQE
jgi:hypothetical protein